MFHSGDNDSTGVIAAACYGAMYGFKGVPQGNYKVIKDVLFLLLSIGAQIAGQIYSIKYFHNT